MVGHGKVKESIVDVDRLTEGKEIVVLYLGELLHFIIIVSHAVYFTYLPGVHPCPKLIVGSDSEVVGVQEREQTFGIVTVVHAHTSVVILRQHPMTGIVVASLVVQP